jgi:hypothetical protein
LSVITEQKAPEVQREVTTADVLSRAADLLEEFGWCQGALARDENGAAIGNAVMPACVVDPHAISFCYEGALRRAAFDFSGDPDGDLYEDAWYAGAGDPSWNDKPGRTKSEVVTALREAASRG